MKVENGEVSRDPPQSTRKKHRCSAWPDAHTHQPTWWRASPTATRKSLRSSGVGYRASKQGKDLVMNLGYSHPVVVSETDGITIEVPDPHQNRYQRHPTNSSVGQFAAEVREKRPPEPYKGKGIQLCGRGHVAHKEGKAGKGAK